MDDDERIDDTEEEDRRYVMTPCGVTKEGVERSTSQHV
jgi:hypothetical protein